MIIPFNLVNALKVLYLYGNKRFYNILNDNIKTSSLLCTCYYCIHDLKIMRIFTAIKAFVESCMKIVSVLFNKSSMIRIYAPLYGDLKQGQEMICLWSAYSEAFEGHVKVVMLKAQNPFKIFPLRKEMVGKNKLTVDNRKIPSLSRTNFSSHEFICLLQLSFPLDFVQVS